MKKHLLPLIVSLGLAGTALLQAAETIKLDQPDLTRGSAVMKALSDRQSIRSCSDKMLSQKDLSDLVWRPTASTGPTPESARLHPP